MSRIRTGACADPGPGEAHCTEHRHHRYSCHDAGEDVSWNDGQWDDGWYDEQPHQCAEPGCPGRPVPAPRLVADAGGPVRCVSLPGLDPLAEEFAAAVGLDVASASQLVDWHIIRGEN